MSPRFARLVSTLVLALLAPLPGRAAEKLRIDFIDVGQGDAALVTSPTGKTVLIDGGPRKAAGALTTFVAGHTRGPLDLVLLTHRHEDHLGGLARVVRERGVRMFLDAPAANAGGAYEALMRALDARGVEVRQATRGRRIDLGGGATLTLVGPPEPPITGSRSDVNANSVVTRLTFGKFAALLAGDAEAPTERMLLASHGGPAAPGALASTVLKVAHHGSRYASGARFLGAVTAPIAIISVGASNGYHHPSPETLARLAASGATVYRTDVDGNVTLETDGRSLTVSTARGRRQVVELP